MGIDLRGTWTLLELDDAAPAAGPRGAVHLTFEGDGVVYGMSGVNSVRGTWTLEDGTLVLGPLVSTLMAGEPGPTATEQALVALRRPRRLVTAAAAGLRRAGDHGSSALLARTAPPDLVR